MKQDGFIHPVDKSTGFETIYTFWYNPKNNNALDDITLRCLLSFAQIENPAIVYTYGTLGNSDTLVKHPGIEIRDANEILSFDKYFSVDYGAVHGFAYFANYFRYMLMFNKRGWWIDSDVVMLQSPDSCLQMITEVAVFYERTTSLGLRRYNNAVLWSLGNQHQYFADALLACEEQFKQLEITGQPGEWGIIGPLLMTMLVQKYSDDKTVTPLGRIPFYFNGYLMEDLVKWVYSPLEDEDSEIIGSLMYSKKLFGVHLWFSAVDFSKMHPKSYYSEVLSVAESKLTTT